jgi:glycosyltransferase involved in cell wall biosynthesis
MTSVIIPAHNEERVLDRLLAGLVAQAEPGEFEVVVVSNGSHDRTAEIAAQTPGVRVVQIDEASKHLALLAGDEVATTFPRLYVDADVELDTSSARALVAALAEPTVLAAAPRRQMVLDGSSWLVRAYYRVWDLLPAVQQGLYGRGVLAVSAEGYPRIADRPQVTADDLYFDTRFAPAERRIVVDAHSRVRGPKTFADLLKRRIRAAQANAEIGSRTQGRSVTTTSSGREIGRIALGRPALWPSLAVFVVVTVCARVGARRRERSGDSQWLRDESSRS